MKTKLGEKEKLRQKILDQSIKVIKKKGIFNASVDSIMESLGLTSGALYSHFSSKEDLLALSIEKQISSLTDYIGALLQTDKKEGMRNWITYYLSEEHVREFQNGCIFAALLSEVSRAPLKIKSVFHSGLNKFYSALEQGLPVECKDKRRTVQTLFSTMVGAVSIARTMKSGTDRDLFLSNTKSSILRSLPL